MANIIRTSEMYGSEAGVGGNVTYHTGSLNLSAGIQNYDMDNWAVSHSISGSDLEIRQVFYQQAPAITRFYDPYAGTGAGQVGLMESFGWGSYSPAVSFLLMPLSFDLQKIQAIELNDQIRKSNYSFELVNNQLRIFPIPTRDTILIFKYLLKSERLANSITQSPGNINNVSNVPYTTPTYSQVNNIGRSWIFEYTLALCKEMLGYVRGKYSTIPIPNQEITLKTVRILCSAPFYLDFLPLLQAMSQRNVVESIRSIVGIWKRGYAYEDILESFQTINTIFGNNNFSDNILIHKFLINSWISYCKGNTSILALQNVIYKTLIDT
jgi:hypothetical protein